MNTKFDPTNEEFDVPDEWDEEPTLPQLHALTTPPQENLPNRWPPQLIFDLALGLNGSEEIEARYNLNAHQIERLYSIPAFRKEVASLTRELHENNTIFKQKAKILADTHLDTMSHLLSDPDTTAATKLQIFQALAKLGELEPEKKLLEKEGTNGAKVIIRIESNVQTPCIDITPEGA